MADQAEALRNIALLRQVSLQAPQTSGARVLSVTSGKGGVGKTNMVCSLSIALARLGKRVVVIDADLGLANVDVLLGLSPRHNLRHVVNGECTLQEIIVTGPAGVKVVPGASGIQAIADLPAQRRSAFLEGIAELEEDNDFIIIDTGAGISARVLDFVLAASEILVVTTPEPTAVADAYAVVKIVTKRGLGDRIRLVVNMAESDKEAAVVEEHIRRVAHEFLGIDLQILGHVLQDRCVPTSVREQTSFIARFPTSAASVAVLRMARDLANAPEVAPAVAAAVQIPGVRGFFARLFDKGADRATGGQK